MLRRTLTALLACHAISNLLVPALAADDATASLRFEIQDANGLEMPCRIHVFDADGKPHQATNLPRWHDHFVCAGTAELTLKRGTYRYEIERGPEHERLSGSVELQAQDPVIVRKPLLRIKNLSSAGWYSGDLHVHRPIEDAPLLMTAEDLHIAPFITWWNQQNLWTDRPLPQLTLNEWAGPRFFDVMAGEDERGGGALLYFGLTRPLNIRQASREYPSPMTFVAAARAANPDVWIDIEKPFWWDVPVWLASGAGRTIGIANNHMCRSVMYPDEAWGRPRDLGRLPNPLGNGLWSQEIYYHALNCGLRLPPSAGSASGVLPNPVGYNRVYVHVDGPLTWDKWWAGLGTGRSFVTNGPLLVCSANGQLPGHLFEVAKGMPLDVELDLSLTSLDHVATVEIIHNGTVVRTLPATDDREQRLLATFSIQESGWFLVRAITDRPETFRFASTAPYYITVKDDLPRISRASADFFAKWAVEREALVRRELTDSDEARAVLAFHAEAIGFWRNLTSRANAD